MAETWVAGKGKTSEELRDTTMYAICLLPAVYSERFKANIALNLSVNKTWVSGAPALDVKINLYALRGIRLPDRQSGFSQPARLGWTHRTLFQIP